SSNLQLGHVLNHSSTTRFRASKRRTQVISAHQVCVSTLSNDVLTVDGGVYGWRLKNRQIGHVVHYISTTRRRTSKRMAPVYSAHDRRIATLGNDVLTVDEGVSGWRLRNRQIGHVVQYIYTTMLRTSKRITVVNTVDQQ